MTVERVRSLVVRQCPLLLIAACFCTAVCNGRRVAEGPLQRSAYVWQRQWTWAVTEAVVASSTQLDGIVPLGAEIEWDGSAAQVVETNIDWDALRRFTKCGIALRVSAVAKRQPMQHFPLATVAGEARRLLSEAKKRGMTVAELQLDFDCPAKELSTYAQAVAAVRAEIQPTRLVLTTLPAWLDSEAFALLLQNCDSYVLQVHSVPLHTTAAEWKICDSAMARRWVKRAADYKKPFAVALPTYRCIAGYTPDGHLLGLMMDSVQGRWPPGTKVREVAADPDELADLVQEWQKRRPTELQEIAWYRLPIATDARNWRLPTFLAVSNGRRPHREVDVISHGVNPVDLGICNNGEADERLEVQVIVNSDQPAIAADALRGWSTEQHGTETVFAPNHGETLQLQPGETCNIGWLRFAAPANLRFELVKK